MQPSQIFINGIKGEFCFKYMIDKEVVWASGKVNQVTNMKCTLNIQHKRLLYYLLNEYNIFFETFIFCLSISLNK